MKRLPREELLRVARLTLEEVVKSGKIPALTCGELELQQPQGAFVTLKNRGRLRGCIGIFEAQEPLWRVVQEMTFSAARHDYRFAGNPITAQELSEIDIEISVLSPLGRVKSAEEIIIKRHGVYLRRDGRTGVYLPQVAEETGWSKEEFLSSLCSHKAGLPPDSWRDPRTELYIFTVEKVTSS